MTEGNCIGTCWVARIDNYNHLGWIGLGELLFKPIQVWVPGLWAAAPIHHADCSPSHLDRHEMIEIVGHKQDNPVVGIQQRQHNVCKRLISSAGHHHLVLHSRKVRG